MLKRESSDAAARRRAGSGTKGWARGAWWPLVAIVVVAMMSVYTSKQQLWEEIDSEQPQVILSKIMKKASFLSRRDAWGESVFEPIRVAIYFNTGSTVRSYNSFMNVFNCFPDLVNVTRVRTLRFNNLNRENFDVLLIGGGSAQAIQEYHEITHKIKLDRVIKNFLMQGGGYVGVCAGAYLAGRYRLSAFESDRTALGEGAMHNVKLESMLDILELSKSLPMSLMEMPWFYANGPFLRNRKDLATTQNVQQGTCLAHFADSGKLDIYKIKRKASRNVHYQGDTNVCLLGHNLYGNGTVISSTGHPEVEVDILGDNLTVNSTQCGTQQAYAIMNMIALASKRSTTGALPAGAGLRRPSRPEPETSLKDLEEFDNSLKKWENIDPSSVDMNEYTLQSNDGQTENSQARWTIEQD